MFEGGGGVATTAGVNWGSLDDCAARSDEPVKTLALWELADRARAIAAATDDWNACQVLAHEVEVNVWVEGEEAGLIQLNPRFQKRQLRTRDDYARIDKLFAVYFRYDANHRIVIPELVGHESPPQRSGEAPRFASSNNRCKLACFPQSY